MIHGVDRRDRLSLNRRGVLGTAAALAVAGCSPVTVLNTLAPSRLVADGVAYGEGERRKLDIYAPAGVGPFPVLVFLYGGAWDSGSRAIYRFLGGAFASHGLVTVIPDYRLYPEVKFPSFLQDCAAAVRWTRDNIGRYGGDAGPFFLMGHSAGAYNAAMLGLDGEWLGQVGMARADLRGVIGVSGPYDFVPDTDALRDIFGPPDHYPQTQPINFVDGHSPPMLLLTGTADTTVKPGNTTRLADRIREKGGFVEARYYEGIDHIEIIGAVGTPLHFLAPTLRDSLAFMGRPSSMKSGG
jgi:acetyl esterase/lipase